MLRPFGARLCLCALLVLIGVAPQRVRASGFDTLGFSADHYNAVTSTPAAAYMNPAALRAGRGLQILVDGNLAFRKASYTRDSSDTDVPTGAEGANTGKATLSNVFGVPTLAASLKLKDWSLGAGVFLPFGGAASWGKNEDFTGNAKYYGAADSTARWHAIEGLWATGYGTLAAGYEVPHTGFSVGVSANVVYTYLETTQAMTANFDDQLAAEGRMNMRLSGVTGTFGLGLQWEVVPKVLFFGLSYQAPPGLWQGMSLKGPLYTNFGTGTNKQNIELEQDFPDIVQGGMRLRMNPQWELRLSGYYERFSAVKSQCLGRGKGSCDVGKNGVVQPEPEWATDAKLGPFANFPRRWHDSLGARLALSRFFGERYELYAGIAFDGSAVPNETLEPGLLDGVDLSGSVGTRIDLSKQLKLGASYMHQVMLTRDNRGESVLSALPTKNRLPTANGVYDQWVGVVNVNLLMTFDGAR